MGILKARMNERSPLSRLIYSEFPLVLLPQHIDSMPDGSIRMETLAGTGCRG